MSERRRCDTVHQAGWPVGRPASQPAPTTTTSHQHRRHTHHTSDSSPTITPLWLIPNPLYPFPRLPPLSGSFIFASCFSHGRHPRITSLLAFCCPPAAFCPPNHSTHRSSLLRHGLNDSTSGYQSTLIRLKH